MISKYFQRFPHAIRGIIYAITNDFGFRTQIYLGAFIIIIITAFFDSLSQFEILFLLLAYVLILITELQNSALETALDRLHPELHDDIKRSKDMAAGSVLIAGSFLLLVLIVICFSG